MAGSVNKVIAAACLVAGMWVGTARAEHTASVRIETIAGPIELQPDPMHVGDIVYLKTSSPPLVITDVNEDNGTSVVTWFVRGERQVAQFPNTALTPDLNSTLESKHERKCQ